MKLNSEKGIVQKDIFGQIRIVYFIILYKWNILKSFFKI